LHDEIMTADGASMQLCTVVAFDGDAGVGVTDLIARPIRSEPLDDVAAVTAWIG
jgi:hypothetical protein